jgi:hypothetical protein
VNSVLTVALSKPKVAITVFCNRRPSGKGVAVRRQAAIASAPTRHSLTP